MNKIVILGRVCRDARIRKTIINGENVLVATFSIKEVRPTKKVNQETCKYYHCICSGKTADYAGLHVKENSLVYVQGSMGMFNKTVTNSKTKLRENTLPANWLRVYGVDDQGDMPDEEYWRISNVAVISGIVKAPIKIQQADDGSVWAYMLLNNVKKITDKRTASHTIRVIAFGKSAYHMYKCYGVGDSVLVYGTAHLNVYINEEGHKQEGWEVIVEHLEKTLPIKEESREQNGKKDANYFSD